MSDELYSQTCRTIPTARFASRKAAWNAKCGSDDMSAKFRWFDANGNPARGGEVPLSALPQMLEVAVKSGYVSLAEA